MSTHGALTEPSVSYRVVTHDRKGREGKGSGREGGEGPSMTSGSRPSRPGWMVDDGLLVAGLMDGGYAGMRGAW